MNTPRLITDAHGNKVWQNDPDEPFGNTIPNQSPNGGSSFQLNLRFGGQYYDVETGTSQNFHRDYDLLTGRYLESDPIGLFGGQASTYAYVSGSPLKYVDPSGLDPKYQDVPGTNYQYRIDDRWLQPNQQVHAHIYDSKGNDIVAVNKDGSGSHGYCPEKDFPKNKNCWRFCG